MKKIIVGVDVGGTNIKIGLFSPTEMQIIDKTEYKTPKNNQSQEVIKSIKKKVDFLITKNGYSYSDLLGIGAALPCIVKEGYVFSCPNIGLENIHFENELIKIFPDIIVRVLNDATLAALGENESLDEPYNNAVMFTMGTGIGGGIIINGEIYEGTSGFGGEIGHIKVHDEDISLCGCGSKGCLEQICGMKGIIDYTLKMAEEIDTMIDLEKINVKRIFDAAKLGDKLGIMAIDRVSKYMGISAAIIGTIIDPEVFIIGGGISKAGDFLLNKIVNEYKKVARFSMGNTPFIIAKTGNDAGIIGAAYYIKKQGRD